MRSATRSSLIMSISVSPSTYSECERASSPSGFRLGAPWSWTMRADDLVRVHLLLVRVLEELRRHRLRVDAGRHVVVPLVAQDAHDLGGQGLVQDLHDRLAVGLVALR